MPLEIRELHIRVSVTSEGGRQAPQQGAATGSADGAGKDDIVAE